MATFMDMLNQGLGGLNTPVGMLGTQLLAQSGPQQGNPSGGVRLGNAVAGMQQQQAQLQQMQQQQALRQIQQQELAVRSAAEDRVNKQQQTLQTVLQSPEAQAVMTPIQRQLMAAGVDPSQIAKIGTPQAKPPVAPGMVDVPQADGTYIRRIWNPQTNKYDDSVPFTPPAAQTANAATGRLQLDQQYRPQELGVKQQTADASTQNAQTAEQQLAVKQAAEQRQADMMAATSKMKRVEFRQAYRGATAQFDEAQQLADEIASSKALPSLYGVKGYIPPVAGSDAADLQAKIDRLVAIGGLTELQKLKQNGVVLTPVSNTDLGTAQTAALNVTKSQSGIQAKSVFEGYSAALKKAKEEAATRFNEYDGLYDKTPTTGTPAAPTQQNAPAAITDDAGYNALPSGTTFTGPDGVLRRKP